MTKAVFVSLHTAKLKEMGVWINQRFSERSQNDTKLDINVCWHAGR